MCSAAVIPMAGAAVTTFSGEAACPRRLATTATTPTARATSNRILSRRFISVLQHSIYFLDPALRFFATFRVAASFFFGAAFFFAGFDFFFGAAFFFFAMGAAGVA